MHSHHLERPLDRPDLYASYLAESNSLWDRLRQPSVLIPLGLLLLTVFYQSLHSSAPFSHVRHPGQLLWDLIVALAPARLLYALDYWLHPPLFPAPESMLSVQSRSYAAKSELLRRILNMDNSNSIMNVVAHVGRKGISSLSSGALTKPKRMTGQPPGLGNYDNSCFQNSILQGLCSLQSLPAYLASALDGDKALNDGGDSSSAATLRDLLSKLRDSQNNGGTLWTPKKLKSLDTWQQQDAQEYYSKILDEIDKEVAKVANIQYRPSGLEIAGIRDDTVESQHSDDSGYQSLSTLSKPVSEGRTPKNPLEGLIAQRVACVQCGHSEGLSMIPFNCITLNLGVDQRIHDLYERLDSYTDLESIEGVECAKCTLLKVQRLLNIIVTRNTDVEVLKEPFSRLEAVKIALEEEDFEEGTLRDKCKIAKQHRVTTTKTKQMVIGRPPSSLAIHINRSVFDENTGHMLKNLAAVRFPSVLDLGPWCLGSAGTCSSGLSDGRGDGDRSTKAIEDVEEQWSSDPKSSMVSGDLKPSKISGPVYELRAVITHQGRHENGHYVCYRKHPRQGAITGNSPDEESESLTDDQTQYDHNGEQVSEQGNTEEDSKWWRLSDETVWEVSEESVLAQGGVFMLFYDCVDPNSVLISNDQGCGPVTLNDKETAEEFGALKAGTGPDAPETEDQFHDTRSEFELLERPKAIILPNEHPPCSKLADAFVADEQPANFATSSLFPLLGQDDDVDPMIPLRWPNS